MAAMSSPKNAEIMVLASPPVPKLDNAKNANSIRTVYSAGPKSMAIFASGGAKKASRKMEMIPPAKEAIADIANACPPLPCLARRLPSMAVTAEAEVPGTLSKMLEMELPYCAP